MGAAALLFTPPDSSASLVLGIIATVTFWAVFGYAVNDVADRRDDRRAGKTNRAAELSTLSWGAFLLLAGSLSLGLSLLWAADAAAPVLVLVGLMLAAAYSLPPLRLKERGAVGLLAGASAQWLLPVLALSSVEPWGWVRPESWCLAFLGLAIGLRWMAVHQLDDASADRKAGVRTYVTGGGRAWHVIVGALLSELGFLTATLWLAWPRSIPAVLALAFWIVQQAFLRPRGEAFAKRLQGYGQAPLAEYYFLLLPLALALGRTRFSSAFLIVAGAFLLLGWGYVERMLGFNFSHRLLRRASPPLP